eukprot:4554489-Karenia_brevis.AAC.1
MKSELHKSQKKAQHKAIHAKRQAKASGADVDQPSDIVPAGPSSSSLNPRRRIRGKTPPPAVQFKDFNVDDHSLDT